MIRSAHILLLVVLLMAACSRAFDPDVRTGAHLRLAEGYPEIIISAIAYIDDRNQPVIDLDLDIIYGSLIYRERDGLFVAEMTLQIEIYRFFDDSGEEFERIKTLREPLLVEQRHASVVDSRESFSWSDRVAVEPGKYAVVFQVTDETSDKPVRKRAHVTVVDPDYHEPNLTHIKVLVSERPGMPDLIPLNTYSIPGNVDTLTFEFQVTRPEDSPPLAVRMRLVQFASDTLPPRPMSGVTPTTGSLQYRGINYNRRDVLESQERILEQETGTITIEYRTARPPRGNYRFEAEVSALGPTEEELLYKARDFSSMSSNFPHIISSRELARPLVYLMRRSEYRDLMDIDDRDTLKHEIDRFWLSNIGDMERASRVIREYYDRVEQANKQFSNFKEGWMTDMGMVYVLFGPPYYVERSLDTMVWIYGYNRADPRRVFYFYRTRIHSDSYPFEHYILQRQNHYHSVEYEQIQRWLSGTILTRPL